MSKININFSNCIHSKSISANCCKCELACTYDAIKIDNNVINFLNDRCTQCQACLPSCPTAAITMSSVNILGYVSSFLEQNSFVINSYEHNFNPISFDIQTLLTILALKKSSIAICVKDSEFTTSIEELIDQTNTYANALGLQTITIQKIEDEISSKVNNPDRRSFFKAFNKKNIVSIAQDINQQSKIISDHIVFDASSINYGQPRTKSIPPNRAGLLAIIANLDLKHPVLVKPIFSTDKIIDISCTNCELCCNLCPTEALSKSRRKDGIFFESSKCIKCALCEDACETKSITSKNDFNFYSFSQKTKIELIHFSVSRCASCSSIFNPKKDEIVCPRCALEDEDAMELSGLF